MTPDESPPPEMGRAPLSTTPETASKFPDQTVTSQAGGTQAQASPAPVIQAAAAAEINRLHSDICDAARTSIEKAIRIGELLTEQKTGLKHGEWLPWLKANVQFTARTASNYQRVFENRLRLKSETISDLTDAYNALTEHAKSEQPADPTKWPKISIKHLGIFLRAFGPEDEDGYCNRLDLEAFNLLGIRLREGHQAVEVYFDESDPLEHCCQFWFHCALPRGAQTGVAASLL